MWNKDERDGKIDPANRTRQKPPLSAWRSRVTTVAAILVCLIVHGACGGPTAPSDIGGGPSPAPASFGSYLGEVNGVEVYSNGASTYYSDSAHYVGSVYTGIEWQCVEFVRRYYLTRFTLDLAAAWQATNRDANQWYNNAGEMNLDSISNGGTKPPEVDDILVSEGGSNGHIAIVRSRSGNQVCTTQQNFSNDTTDLSRCLTLSSSGSSYTVSGFSPGYPIRGWLRRRGTGTSATVGN
jgi:surface antigen